MPLPVRQAKPCQRPANAQNAGELTCETWQCTPKLSDVVHVRRHFETPCTSKRFRETPGSCIICVICIICLGKAIPTAHVLRGQHGKRGTRKSHKKSRLGLGSNQCPVTFHILGPSQNPCRRCYIGDAQPIVLVTKATKCGVRMITNRLTVSPGLRHRHLGAPTAAMVDFKRARHRGTW
ncbi:hypothetical protein EDB80DRAFT_429937 [Ilyonectria destructans]|nr:hypothetical protein EDB80DRAFT_429937 [Ilyonectria destructans]